MLVLQNVCLFWAGVLKGEPTNVMCEKVGVGLAQVQLFVKMFQNRFCPVSVIDETHIT